MIKGLEKRVPTQKVEYDKQHCLLFAVSTRSTNPILLLLTNFQDILYRSQKFEKLAQKSEIAYRVSFLFTNTNIYIVIENSRGCFKIYGKSIKCKNRQIKLINMATFLR